MAKKKTEAQIKAEFEALPWYKQLAQAGGDIANIGVNSATGGLFNRGIAWAMDADQAAREEMEREQMVRSGIAGNVADIGGMLFGLKGIGTAISGGGKAAARAIAPNAAPQAARVVGQAGVRRAPIIAAKAPKKDLPVRLYNAANSGSIPAQAAVGGLSSVLYGQLPELIPDMALNEIPETPSETAARLATDFALGAVGGAATPALAKGYLKLSGGLDDVARRGGERILKTLNYSPEQIAAMPEFLRRMVAYGGTGLVTAGPMGAAKAVGGQVLKAPADLIAKGVANTLGHRALGPAFTGALIGTAGNTVRESQDIQADLAVQPPSVSPVPNSVVTPEGPPSENQTTEFQIQNPIYQSLSQVIGERESQNNYGAVSPNSSARGKYQMTAATLKQIGRLKPEYYEQYGTRAVDMEDAYVGGRSAWMAGKGQEEDFQKAMAMNERDMRNKLKGIDEDGNEVGWADLDESTRAEILRQAWFQGGAGARKWLRSGVGVIDANGTTPDTY